MPKSSVWKRKRYKNSNHAKIISIKFPVTMRDKGNGILLLASGMRLFKKADVFCKVLYKHLKTDFPLVDAYADLESTTTYIMEILICVCCIFENQDMVRMSLLTSRM